MADAGGVHLLAWGPLLFYVPLTLFASVLSREPSDAAAVLDWTAVNVAAIATTALWIALLRTALSARRRALGDVPLGALNVVLIGTSVGVVKTLTMSLIAWTGGLLPLLPASELWRLAGNAVQGAVLVPMLAIIPAALERFRRDYDLLVRERIRRSLLHDAPVELRRHQLLTHFVADARRRLELSQDEPAVQVLQDLLEQRLRPLARRLWSDEGPTTDFTLRSLARVALLGNPLPLIPILALHSAVSVAARTQFVSPAVNLLHALGAAGAIAAVLLLAQRLRPTRPALLPVHFSATMVAAVAAQFMATGLIPPGNQATSAAIVINALLWLSVVTVMSGATVAALRSREAVRRQLDAAIPTSTVDRSVQRLREQLTDRELANRLHSTVQNRVINAVQRLAQQPTDRELARSELSAIDRLLRDLMAETAEESGGDLEQRLAELAAQWRGFVTIDISIDEAVVTSAATSLGLADSLVHAVAEGVTNAVRHGRAEHITIGITSTDGTIELVIEDDGIGPTGGPEGTGSQYFATLSGGAWSRSARSKGGTRLRICFPTS